MDDLDVRGVKFQKEKIPNSKNKPLWMEIHNFKQKNEIPFNVSSSFRDPRKKFKWLK